MAYNPNGAQGSTLTTVASSVLNRNKESAVRGAYLEAGRIATDATAKLAAKHLPMMMRGYADTPVGKIVLANLAQAAVAQFRPAEPKLVKLTQAMADNAFAELYQSFDVQGFIDGLVNSKEGQAALSRIPD